MKNTFFGNDELCTIESAEHKASPQTRNRIIVAIHHVTVIRLDINVSMNVDGEGNHRYLTYYRLFPWVTADYIYVGTDNTQI